MLCDLNISNFVIIDRLSLAFSSGLNVLTGETGAGKSIIIDALDLLLGGKARTDLIRHGADEAVIEALFDLRQAEALRNEVSEAGFDNGSELLVRRVLSTVGKNRIYINGSLATAAQLQAWIGRIVAIYGQHEQFGLARVETHGPLLDRYAGITRELADYRSHYHHAREIRAELSHLDAAQRERLERLELLEYQLQEIAAANLRSGEDDELLNERKMIQNAEKLAGAASEGYESLYAGHGAICEQLSRLAVRLRELGVIDATLISVAETIHGAFYSLEDAAAQLRHYAARIAFDPERLEVIEARLDLLGKLKRKYGSGIDDILRRYDAIQLELMELRDVDTCRSRLEADLHEAEKVVAQLGAIITQARARAAVALQAGIEQELQDLAMPKARFSVVLTPLAEPSSHGFEKIEFFLQANPGEGARPLARVASGGELSRLMLAIQRTAPTGAEAATLIFDEVDAGIGGAAATAVGEKLRAVADGRQVLCITHLPQVAAFAHHHYQVGKEETSDERTRTSVRRLDEEEQVGEIARMLGGAKITEQTLAHARELIRLSIAHH